MLQVTARNYSTRNHTGGTNFLLANTGQQVTETVMFVVDFDYTSNSNNPIQVLSDNTLQVIGIRWFDLGFLLGDVITLSATFTDSGTNTISGTYEIIEINDSIIKLDAPITFTGSGDIIGKMFPLSGQSTPLVIINDRTIPESVELLHNLVPNTVSGTEFSPIDGEVNRFEVNGVSGMSVSDSLPMIQLGRKSGGTYQDATLTRSADVGGKACFVYSLKYYSPFHTIGIPEQLNASQSVKPYIVLKCLPEENNPNSNLLYKDGLYLGNYGWYNEEHNQGINDFTIQSVTLTDSDGNTLNTVDYAQRTKVTATITADGNFFDGVELEFNIFPDDIKNKIPTNGRLIHLVNSYVTTAGATQNDFGEVSFDNEEITLTTGQCVVSFDIVPTTDFTTYIESLPSEERNFRVSCTVESAGGDANSNNCVSLELIYGTLEKAPIIGGEFTDLVDEFRDHADNVIESLCESDCECVRVSFTYDGVDYSFDVPKVGLENGKNQYVLEDVIPYNQILIGWAYDNLLGWLWYIVINGDVYNHVYYNTTDNECPFFDDWTFDSGVEVENLTTTPCGCEPVIYQGCTEDDFMYQADIDLRKNTNYKTLEATIVIERDSDSQQFKLQSDTINFGNYPMLPNGVIQVNYNNPQVQYLDAPERNKLTAVVSSIGSLSYSVRLSLSLMANWRYWLSQSNAFVDFYDLDLPSNGQSKEWMRYLREAGYTLKLRCNLIDDADTLYFWEREIQLQDYDADAFIESEITLYDSTGNPSTAILDGQLMTIKARHTLTDESNWNESGLWGWISIRPKEAEPNKRISSEWTPTVQDIPLKAPCTLTYISPSIVEVECTLDASQVISEFSTIICRIEQFDDKNPRRQVHKQEFKKVTIPNELRYEDRGLEFCKEPQLVVASLSDNAWHKNDRTGIAYKFDAMTIQLEDADGNLTDAPGISVTFPNQSDAVGFIIDWRQVTNGDQLKQGCYKVRVNYELAGVESWFYYGSYLLREYSQLTVSKTVRIWVFLNDFVRKQGINYKDSGFCTSIRFRGQFGYMQPKYDTENLILSDRTRNKIRIEANRTYELRSQYLLPCMTRQIDEEILLTANQIFISDHNANNHVQYYDFPVIISDEESPQFEYNESIYAKIKAVFKEKKALSESKYQGNINGFDSPLFELPQPISGNGICANATVKNSNNTYSQSVASGGTLTLPDTNVNIYVDGALSGTGTIVTLDSSEEINILWT